MVERYDGRWTTDARTRCFFIFLAAFFLINTVAYGESRLYDSRGRRDPFVPLLGVTSQTVGSLEDVISLEDITLQGVASNAGGEKIVILNGEMIKEGETVGRVTVRKISKDDILLSIEGTDYTMKISEEMQ